MLSNPDKIYPGTGAADSSTLIFVVPAGAGTQLCRSYQKTLEPAFARVTESDETTACHILAVSPLVSFCTNDALYFFLSE